MMPLLLILLLGTAPQALAHDEPYMVHVAPGKAGEIGWRFDKAGTFHFGCLVPGHFEAGMVGKVTVQ